LKRLSVVATLFNSSAYVEEFCKRASIAARKLVENDFEIVLVNDGSPDDSLQRAVRLAETDTHIKIVDLSRNFGHHKAMMTGLMQAEGHQVFLIDSDLEEDPEWMVAFSSKMKDEQSDVVYGVQNSRKGGVVERVTGAAFYRLFRTLSDVDVPANITVARLMSRRYVDSLIRHQESELFLAGLWAVTGYNQTPFVVRKLSTSRTTYTFRKKISQFVNSITSFSNAPLKMIFYSGCIILGGAGIFSLYLIFNWIFLAKPPSGYTSLMVSIWILGGLIVAYLGVIGMYLAKIYSETKRRPYSIIRGVFSGGRWTDSKESTDT
jgi:putative glycosyltransferase